MEQDPRAVDRKREEARGSAILKVLPLHLGISAEWDPAEEAAVAKAEEVVVVKAKEAAVVKAEDEAVDRARVR